MLFSCECIHCGRELTDQEMLAGRADCYLCTPPVGPYRVTVTLTDLDRRVAKGEYRPVGTHYLDLNGDAYKVLARTETHVTLGRLPELPDTGPAKLDKVH